MKFDQNIVGKKVESLGYFMHNSIKLLFLITSGEAKMPFCGLKYWNSEIL